MKNNRGFVPVLILVWIVLAVAGYFGYRNFQEKNKPRLFNDVLPQPTTTSDPTSDWKTYTNKDFGFFIKYPNDMFIISENYLAIDNKPTQTWEVHFSNKNKEETAKEGSDYSFYIQIDLQPKNRNGTHFTEKDIETVHQGYPETITLVTFDGFKASKYSSYSSNPDGTKGSTISYYIFDGKRLIYLVGMSNHDSSFSKEKLDQILSTFEFTK